MTHDIDENAPCDVFPLTGDQLAAVCNADHPDHAAACAAVSLSPVTGHATTTVRTFDTWMAAVDHHLVRQAGLTHRRLPAHPWLAEYARGADPERSARGAITRHRAHETGFTNLLTTETAP
jgi:hypothetical protein